MPWGNCVLGRSSHCSYPRRLSWRPQMRCRVRITFPLSLLLSLFLRYSFGAHHEFSGQVSAAGKGELATSRRARTADRERTVHIFAMSYISRSHVKNDSTKKQTIIVLANHLLPDFCSAPALLPISFIRRLKKGSQTVPPYTVHPLLANNYPTQQKPQIMLIHISI